MFQPVKQLVEKTVAPFTGAWIEIPSKWVSQAVPSSLPSRERGLKCIGCVG